MITASAINALSPFKPERLTERVRFISNANKPCSSVGIRFLMLSVNISMGTIIYAILHKFSQIAYNLFFILFNKGLTLSSLIKLENITKVYRMGENELPVLKNVHFQLDRGEMTAIVGMSGSGKSTLMNILGFLDRCTEGRYIFSGRDVSYLSELELAAIRNQKIGFVFQSFFLLPRSTALQNVMLPLFYRGTPRAEAERMARQMLEKVGMAHLAEHKPNQLSGGQQQRVAIARALVGDPEVILADEPTGALDSQTGDEVMELFTTLNRKEGRTIVIITHDKSISARCQRVVMMKDGRIVDVD